MCLTGTPLATDKFHKVRLIRLSFYGSPKSVDADIVIPIYNDEVQLADSVSTLCSFLDRHSRDLAPFSWNIVIADNASTHASWQIAKSLCDWCPNQVRALHLARKGRGYALKQAWLSSRAAVMAYMDVDLSTDIGFTGSLILPLLQGGADIAFGSRLDATVSGHPLPQT